MRLCKVCKRRSVGRVTEKDAAVLKVIDTLISMCLIYIVLSVLASALTEAWASSFAQRAKHLKLGLARLLGEGAVLQTTAKEILTHPLVASTSRVENGFPSYLSAQSFSNALVDTLLSSGKSGQGAWSEKETFDALGQAIAALDGDALKKTLRPLYKEGDQSIEAFRHRIEALFDGHMDRVTGWYKRYAQGICMCMGFVLVVSLNMDSIQLFQDFWKNAQLREVTTNIATVITEDNDVKSNVAKAQKELLAAGLRVGWSPEATVDGCGWSPDS